MVEFDAIIQSPPDAPRAAYICVPCDVKEVFGTRARVAVNGTFDSQPYRGTIQPMTGGHFIGVSAEMRTALGKNPGDTIHVVMEQDTGERTVEIPADLLTALDSHKKEYVEYITEAKKPETRARRVEKTVGELTNDSVIPI